MAIHKNDLEQMALDFRHDAGVTDDFAPFDPLDLDIEGIRIVKIREIDGLDPEIITHLTGPGASFWSAMTVPCDSKQERWVIVLNCENDVRRQRPSLMEELWHILLGHKLTKITKIGSQYGRGFDSENEHDAFYAAAATLLPYPVIKRFVEDQSRNVAEFADNYGVSRELVEYRVKRLGWWRKYLGHEVRLRSVTTRSGAERSLE